MQRLTTTAIAIIGSGPRGMSVLERILHRAASASDLRFAVRLFETRSNPHGSGCHVSSQPAHLLLNTASDQI